MNQNSFKPVAPWVLLLLGLLAISSLPVLAQGSEPLDRYEGIPVIEALDLDGLSRGAVHRFYLRGSETSVGQPWMIPVVVVHGARTGKVLGLNAAIHGDELNGIAVVQDLLDQLDPEAMSGSVIAIPALNIPGLLANNRSLPGSNGGGYQVNLNRIMPSGPKETDPGGQMAWRVWSGVFDGRVDAAVDLHSQTIGTAYPLYVFADHRNEAVARMARLVAPDMIKIDPGLSGTLETAFIQAGVPAITLEVGEPKRFQPALIERAVAGLERILADLGIMPVAPTASGSEPYVGNDTTNVKARHGGIARILVGLGDEVRVGMPVARISDLFGREIAVYKAPVDGRVLAIATDPLREPGSLLVRILWQNPDRACKDGC